MGAIVGRLGYTSVGSAQHRALRTELAGIAAEESETVYTLKDLLLEEVKEALSTNLEA
jgi:hypothetical protein